MKLNLLRSMARDLVLGLQKPIDPKLAGERLAIVHARFASESTDTVVVVVGFDMVPDAAYVSGPDVANFDVRWLMNASERAAQRNCGILLTHLHEHKGVPWFSPADLRTARAVLYPMYRICPQFPQGALVMSFDSAAAIIATAEGFFGVRNVALVK